MFVLTGIYAACLVATTVVGGIWSDRVGRRRVFVAVSGLVAATASVILAVTQTWPGALVAAVVLGTGYGVYTAVDFALITQVLPAAEARAKDLGVINIANALPQVFAPFMATVLVTVLGGYLSLYLFSAGVCVLGSVLVYRIKTVR